MPPRTATKPRRSSATSTHAYKYEHSEVDAWAKTPSCASMKRRHLDDRPLQCCSTVSFARLLNVLRPRRRLIKDLDDPDNSLPSVVEVSQSSPISAARS